LAPDQHASDDARPDTRGFTKQRHASGSLPAPRLGQARRRVSAAKPMTPQRGERRVRTFTQTKGLTPRDVSGKYVALNIGTALRS
jgi:hypothetical protein